MSSPPPQQPQSPPAFSTTLSLHAFVVSQPLLLMFFSPSLHSDNPIIGHIWPPPRLITTSPYLTMVWPIDIKTSSCISFTLQWAIDGCLHKPLFTLPQTHPLGHVPFPPTPCSRPNQITSIPSSDSCNLPRETQSSKEHFTVKHQNNHQISMVISDIHKKLNCLKLLKHF